MSVAAALLRRHFDTFVADPDRWRTLIADDVVWELPFAPALGHPASLSGRQAVLNHVGWFLAAVEDFRFADLRIYASEDADVAIAEVKAVGRIKETGRVYRQDYVLIVRARDGKLAFIREYFDPVRAAVALDAPVVGLPA